MMKLFILKVLVFLNVVYVVSGAGAPTPKPTKIPTRAPSTPAPTYNDLDFKPIFLREDLNSAMAFGIDSVYPIGSVTYYSILSGETNFMNNTNIEVRTVFVELILAFQTCYVERFDVGYNRTAFLLNNTGPLPGVLCDAQLYQRVFHF